MPHNPQNPHNLVKGQVFGIAITFATGIFITGLFVEYLPKVALLGLPLGMLPGLLGAFFAGSLIKEDSHKKFSSDSARIGLMLAGFPPYVVTFIAYFVAPNLSATFLFIAPASVFALGMAGIFIGAAFSGEGSTGAVDKFPQPQPARGGDYGFTTETVALSTRHSGQNVHQDLLEPLLPNDSHSSDSAPR